MTYHKYDRVKIEQEIGKVVTVTIMKLLISTDSYSAVTSTGKKLTVQPSEIVGLA